MGDDSVRGLWILVFEEREGYYYYWRDTKCKGAVGDIDFVGSLLHPFFPILQRRGGNEHQLDGEEGIER